MPEESVALDQIDRQILHSLHLAPRAPFAVLAGVLGISEQTVARRYRRMRRDGIVRVLGVRRPEGRGETAWVVRIRCRPGGAPALARALAQREDVSWVSIAAGAVEVVCSVRSPSARIREDLLVDRLPRSSPVLGVEVAMVMHGYVVELSEPTGLRALDDAQRAALTEWSVSDPAPDASTWPLLPPDAHDRALLARLSEDGRATYADLAAVSGTTAGAARRRLRSLLAAGLVYLDVDVSPDVIDRAVAAHLWATVRPGDLDAAGRRVADLPGVEYAAAITGQHNLLVSVTSRDHRELYELVTQGVGSLPGIVALEISPWGTVVKRTGTLVADGRLAP
ncbi:MULTISPECIES: Lrp/AsnC family transcriptional regulator [unclassified Nocardioides]|uniref:Lrp/AsnC family transcriptional regulator n=1 Tax=unclassified Nocardioides TaxID=2615069 RepID=UPI0030149A00